MLLFLDSVGVIYHRFLDLFGPDDIITFCKKLFGNILGGILGFLILLTMLLGLPIIVGVISIIFMTPIDNWAKHFGFPATIIIYPLLHGFLVVMVSNNKYISSMYSKRPAGGVLASLVLITPTLISYFIFWSDTLKLFKWLLAIKC